MKILRLLAILLVSLAFPSAASAQLTAKVVSNWTLDEASGATRQDATASNNDLTETAATASASALNGNGASFNGTSGTELISGAALFDPGNTSFAVAAWVNFSSLAATARVLSKLTAANGEYQLVYDVTANRLRFEVWGSGGYGGAAHADWSAAPSTGVWYLVIAEHDATADTLSIQVNNGTIVTTTGFTSGIYSDLTSVLSVGDSLFYGAAPTAIVDEVSYFNSTLDSTERACLWNSGAGLTYANFGTCGGGGGTTPRGLLLGVGE